tara:strand:- start:1971 stop:3521 length:1551 start_codon:yes stop_codon:yes gene_type:complete
MEIDAMQYASISSELLRGNNYFHFFDNGYPYLDKPPLLFWTTALFFRIFGISELVFRIPSIIFSLLTIYSTYKFSRLYYNKSVAMISALILSSCLAFMVLNSDVKTDIFMIGPMMIAVWQLAQYFQKNHWKNLVFGFIGISFAMMGKGPLGMIIPITVICIDLIMKKKIKQLNDFRLIFGIALVLLFLFPMSIGLYNQFGIRGLKFFYWDQSFGRITGASSWNNETGIFYLFNVFLYSFLPWTFIFLWAFVDQSKNIIMKNKSKLKPEVISYVGFILPTIFLSMSNYKLPHYIYCVLPFASIITANKIVDWFKFEKDYKKIFFIQIIILIFMLSVIYIFSIFSFELGKYFFIPPIFIICIGVWLFYNIAPDGISKFLIPSIITSILCSYGFNIGILKSLMKYQAPSEAAKYILDQKLDYDNIFLFKENEKAKSRSFNFYLNQNTEFVDEEFFENNKKEKLLIFTNEAGYKDILKRRHTIKILKSFEHVRVSKIKKEFINPSSRYIVLEKKYLLKIS